VEGAWWKASAKKKLLNATRKKEVNDFYAEGKRMGTFLHAQFEETYMEPVSP